jgi:hypothetical protein
VNSHRLERYPIPIAYPGWSFDRADGIADQLDDFVEKALIPEYTRGRIRKQDTAY